MTHSKQAFFVGAGSALLLSALAVAFLSEKKQIIASLAITGGGILAYAFLAKDKKVQTKP